MSNQHQEYAPLPVNPEMKILQLGPAALNESVLIGSAALHTAFNEAMQAEPGSDRQPFRQPYDIDIVVSEGVFRHLRAQHPDWQESQFLEGAPRLRGDNYDIGLAWWYPPQHSAYQKVGYEKLRERGWRTQAGITVASLADVSAWKGARNSSQDRKDLAFLQAELHSSTHGPLPWHTMPYEIAAIKSILPEHLQQDPEAQNAIWLAASGLHTVSTLYGHRSIGRANQIIGELELPSYNVAATYHNGFGLLDDLQRLQQHFDTVNAADLQQGRPLTFGTQDQLDGLAADAYSDAVYGNGRRSDNPDRYDELRSASLAEAHALHAGLSLARAGRIHRAILGTAFSEATGDQPGKHSTDPLVRAVTGNDLQILSEPECLESALDLAIEDGMSARFSAARTIGKTMSEHNVRIGSTREGLTFITEHSDARPSSAPDGPSVLQAFTNRLIGNSSFQNPDTGYQPPHDWTLHDSALRRENVAKLGELSSALQSRSITPLDALEQAQQHTAALRTRYL
jgi:hypothetical protein